ncbi:MAG TPA: M48 family peptidase [Chromatiales bacterium]|nr:M48 family peptidase [Chromatiales bacterium]HEX22396.1 M48 family peptidase [Chromatiales bacterium]
MKTSMAENILRFGTRRIEYRLHRTDRKRLRIVVSPELTVDVYAPGDADNDQIEAAVRKKAAWIARKLDNLESYHPLPAPTCFVSGETIVYLGRQYRLKVTHGPKQPAKLLGQYLWVWVEDKTDTKAVKLAVDSWFRQRADEVFGRYLEKCQQVTSRHGVQEPLLVVRAMRRRWGSCSPAGRITLNVKLMQVPVHCIEYVIMHELCHLKHHNHSKLFYALLTRCLPDWRKRKEILGSVRLS